MFVSNLVFKVDAKAECLNLFEATDDSWVVEFITSEGVAHRRRFGADYTDAFHFYTSVLKRVISSLDTQAYITELFK